MLRLIQAAEHSVLSTSNMPCSEHESHKHFLDLYIWPFWSLHGGTEMCLLRCSHIQWMVLGLCIGSAYSQTRCFVEDNIKRETPQRSYGYLGSACIQLSSQLRNAMVEAVSEKRCWWRQPQHCHSVCLKPITTCSQALAILIRQFLREGRYLWISGGFGQRQRSCLLKLGHCVGHLVDIRDALDSASQQATGRLANNSINNAWLVVKPRFLALRLCSRFVLQPECINSG